MDPWYGVPYTDAYQNMLCAAVGCRTNDASSMFISIVIVHVPDVSSARRVAHGMDLDVPGPARKMLFMMLVLRAVNGSSIGCEQRRCAL